MDVLDNLKRSTPVSLNLCIICQEERRDILYDASEKGLGTLSKITHERQKLRDVKYKYTVDRVLNVLNGDSKKEIHWHKTCYATYTSKERLGRLKNASLKESGRYSSSDSLSTSRPAESQPSCRNRHSRAQHTNCELCLICQQKKAKQKLISITTFNKSQEILGAAKFDQEMSVHVAAVSDLIAAEGKYHLSCYVQFIRRTSQTKENSQHTDIAIIWICNELQYSADHGHILELREVWNQYRTMVKESNLDIPVPPSFASQMGTHIQG